MRIRTALLGVVAATMVGASPLASAATASLETDPATGQQECYIVADASTWDSAGHGQRVLKALTADFPQAAPQLNELFGAVKDNPTQQLPEQSAAAIDRATASAGFDPKEAETMLRAASYASLTGFYDKPLSVTRADLMDPSAKQQSAESIAAEYVHTPAARSYFVALLRADRIDMYAADFNAALASCAELLSPKTTQVTSTASFAPPALATQVSAPAATPVPAATTPSASASPTTAAPAVTTTVSTAQQVTWLTAALVVVVLATLGLTSIVRKE